jgi:hypothetical protein
MENKCKMEAKSMEKLATNTEVGIAVGRCPKLIPGVTPG